MTTALSTHDLAIGYRHRRETRTVLSQINVEVLRGELVCVLGVNGIGKSTLMRTLARAQPSLGGTIAVNGADLASLSQYELARTVGVVLTERISVGSMPAYRLVELGRYPHVDWAGNLSDGDRQIVADAIAAVGASHLAHRDLNEISDGERQRIMIARALAQRPTVLLLDEPSAFLDVSARVEIIAMLRRLAREQQVAVILSSHDLDLALRSADTIWLFDGRGALQGGAPEDLLANGSISAAFSGPNIAFDPGQLSFRILAKPRFTAFVSGPAGRVDLIRPLLEREGFAMADTSGAAHLSVTLADDGWSAESRLGEDRGSTYAALARFVRIQTSLLEKEAVA
jgi:iron complex transport system ATP-binding protein